MGIVDQNMRRIIPLGIILRKRGFSKLAFIPVQMIKSGSLSIEIWQSIRNKLIFNVTFKENCKETYHLLERRFHQNSRGI